MEPRFLSTKYVLIPDGMICAYVILRNSVICTIIVEGALACCGGLSLGACFSCKLYYWAVLFDSRTRREYYSSENVTPVAANSITVISGSRADGKAFPTTRPTS